MATLAEARMRSVRGTSDTYVSPAPACPGRTVTDIPGEELLSLINYRAFMSAWKLPATLGRCLRCARLPGLRGGVVTVKRRRRRGATNPRKHLDLPRDARRVIEEICGTPGKIRGVTTIVEGRSEGDDIVAGEVRFPTLRRQQPDESGRYPAVADYVAPKGDYIGAFAVTVHTEDEVARLEAEGDSYGSLLMQTVSHRVAEAAAEWLHRHVRRELWGYAKDEPDMSLDELYEGKYSGIRPAMVIPRCPTRLSISSLTDCCRWVRYA